MANRVYIVRPGHSKDEEREPITRVEWRAHVQSDPELRFDGEDSASWSGAAAGELALLTWRDGSIQATDPPAPFIAKMAKTATALHAIVQGEAGEPRLPRAPLRLDPLQWQMVAWGGSIVVMILAAVVVIVAVRG